MSWFSYPSTPFSESGTNTGPERPSPRVASGVYRWSRNPQNVGWAVVYVGAALFGRSGLALVLAGLFWVSFLIYLPLEEEHLGRIFGNEYREYAFRTARFWGRARRS